MANYVGSAMDGALKGIQIFNAVSDAWDKYKLRSDMSDADDEYNKRESEINSQIGDENNIALSKGTAQAYNDTQSAVEKDPAYQQKMVDRKALDARLAAINNEPDPVKRQQMLQAEVDQFNASHQLTDAEKTRNNAISAIQREKGVFAGRPTEIASIGENGRATASTQYTKAQAADALDEAKLKRFDTQLAAQRKYFASQDPSKLMEFEEVMAQKRAKLELQMDYRHIMAGDEKGVALAIPYIQKQLKGTNQTLFRGENGKFYTTYEGPDGQKYTRLFQPSQATMQALWNGYAADKLLNSQMSLEAMRAKSELDKNAQAMKESAEDHETKNWEKSHPEMYGKGKGPTLERNEDGTYSISGGSGAAGMSLTVNKTDDGKFIATDKKTGDTMQIVPGEGMFGLNEDPEKVTAWKARAKEALKGEGAYDYPKPINGRSCIVSADGKKVMFYGSETWVPATTVAKGGAEIDLSLMPENLRKYRQNEWRTPFGVSREQWEGDMSDRRVGASGEALGGLADADMGIREGGADVEGEPTDEEIAKFNETYGSGSAVADAKASGSSGGTAPTKKATGSAVADAKAPESLGGTEPTKEMEAMVTERVKDEAGGREVVVTGSPMYAGFMNRVERAREKSNPGYVGKYYATPTLEEMYKGHQGPKGVYAGPDKKAEQAGDPMQDLVDKTTPKDRMQDLIDGMGDKPKMAPDTVFPSALARSRKEKLAKSEQKRQEEMSKQKAAASKRAELRKETPNMVSENVKAALGSGKVSANWDKSKSAVSEAKESATTEKMREEVAKRAKKEAGGREVVVVDNPLKARWYNALERAREKNGEGKYTGKYYASTDMTDKYKGYQGPDGVYANSGKYKTDPIQKIIEESTPQEQKKIQDVMQELIDGMGDKPKMNPSDVYPSSAKRKMDNQKPGTAKAPEYFPMGKDEKYPSAAKRKMDNQKPGTAKAPEYFPMGAKERATSAAERMLDNQKPGTAKAPEYFRMGKDEKYPSALERGLSSMGNRAQKAEAPAAAKKPGSAVGTAKSGDKPNGAVLGGLKDENYGAMRDKSPSIEAMNRGRGVFSRVKNAVNGATAKFREGVKELKDRGVKLANDPYLLEGLCQLEGWNNGNDFRGIPTIGWGSKLKEGEKVPEKFTSGDALKRVDDDISKRMQAISKAFPNAPESVKSGIAVVSYNIGDVVRRMPKFTAAIRNGDMQEAKRQLMDTVYSGGKIYKGYFYARSFAWELMTGEPLFTDKEFARISSMDKQQDFKNFIKEMQSKV